MRILFDTNIILDVLLNRKPFVNISSTLVAEAESGLIDGLLCATTITSLDYLISKASSRRQARSAIKKLLTIFSIAEVNTQVLMLALSSNFSDFEDAVQYYSAERKNSVGIVTRNAKDYKSTHLAIYSPEELWGMVSALRQ